MLKFMKFFLFVKLLGLFFYNLMNKEIKYILYMKLMVKKIFLNLYMNI